MTLNQMNPVDLRDAIDFAIQETSMLAGRLDDLKPVPVYLNDLMTATVRELYLHHREVWARLLPSDCVRLYTAIVNQVDTLNDRDV